MHKVSKLNESTDYHFRIFASNDAGDGHLSDIYSYRTTKAPPAAMKGLTVSVMILIYYSSKLFVYGKSCCIKPS
jgi:hypothetical protein